MSVSGKTCDKCGRPSASYAEHLNLYGAFRHPPFPPEGTCAREHQAQDHYDNGQCEDCATYPLKKRIAELEAECDKLRAEVENGSKA